MSYDWMTTTLTDEDEVFHVLAELRGKRWMCRGQARRYAGLVPSIDRNELKHLSRSQKLIRERQSINLFRTTARFFTHPGEQGALTDDIVALMVLRHYNVPTRLLDWSVSPYVAAYFATCGHKTDDGEIWGFDEPMYEDTGKQQWRKWPETTTDRSGDPSKFDAKLTAFSMDEPPDWFICGFYTGFPRQDAQDGRYTMAARFGRDHAEAVANLLGKPTRYHQWIVAGNLKSIVQRRLRESYGIWRGSLFPDTAGAAETASTVFAI
jgi:hypothetical protein